jgi:hypothetical protein
VGTRIVSGAELVANKIRGVIVPGQEGQMDLKLKTISKSGIGEAIAKAELYRYLNEPEEAESICRDILAADPQNMLGMRMLNSRDGHRIGMAKSRGSSMG